MKYISLPLMLGIMLLFAGCTSTEYSITIPQSSATSRTETIGTTVYSEKQNIVSIGIGTRPAKSKNRQFFTVMVFNRSPHSIILSPENIRAYYVAQSGDSRELNIYTSKELMNEMNNRMAFSEQLSPADKLTASAISLGLPLTFLKEQPVPSKQWAGGDIQVEMPNLESKGTLTIEIEVGSEIHALALEIHEKN